MSDDPTERERGAARSSDVCDRRGLPLGGAAFVSPLGSLPARSTRSRRVELWILLSSAVLSSGAIGAALLLRAERSTGSLAAADEVRAEPKVAAASSEARPHAAAAARAPAAQSAPARRAAAESAGSVEAPSSPAATAPREARPRPTQALREAAGRSRTIHARLRRRDAKPPETLQLEPTRAQVVASMRSITPQVIECFGETYGAASARFSVVGKTGRVTAVRVDGMRGSVGSCIARAVRRAKFPQFGRDTFEIRYPFTR